MTRRADMPRAFSRCHYLSVDAGAESENIHLRNSVSVKIVKHRNAFVACLARSAYRTKYAHDFSIFSSSFASKATDNFRQNFSRYTFSIICISHFFYLFSFIPKTHHVSVKSCVVILRKLTRKLENKYLAASRAA